ncbi:hypothetical protein [Vibrio alfacsensis]|uniref:hypothetical protein n=1 Tax=Vibrio alfacsensis TaxID=1074311 RepID=UPI00406968CB
MAKQQFYIPICVDNLAQFFAFGFITPASVFPIGHYIPDELSRHSNVIPLHRKPTAKAKIPAHGVKATRKEDAYAKSAIVVVTLDGVNPEPSESSTWLYLENILPTYCISEIIFEDQSAHEHFDYLTRTTGRVSDELLNRVKFKKGGFDKLLQPEDPSELVGVEGVLETNRDERPLEFEQNLLYKMSGYGAALALTYVMAKNGKVANDAFKVLSNVGANESDSASPLAIKLTKRYLFRDFEEDSLKHRIQDEFFDLLINCGPNEKVLDKLIPFFDLDLGDPKATEFLQGLKTRLSDILKGKVESTNSEQMEAFRRVDRVSQFIDQVLTMFSLLDETEKLFTQPIHTISGEGYVNIAMAYGMRDKFYEVPKSVRRIEGLECFVIERMYEYFLAITNQTSEKVKQEFSIVPTLVDILDDSQTPQLKNVLSHKFDLVSKNLKQIVSVGEHIYIPEHPEKLIKILPSNESEFEAKMIVQRAFEDVDFNVILKLYEEEKALAKTRKKFLNQLNKL